VDTLEGSPPGVPASPALAPLPDLRCRRGQWHRHGSSSTPAHRHRSTQRALRFFPAGTTPPLSTSIDYAPGQTRSNNGILLLGTGQLDVTCHQSSGTAHVVVDVNGYFAETTEP
jgi:hypothetical protein